MPTSARRCLVCNALEPIDPNGPVWPLGWQCGGCRHVVAQDQGIAMFAPELADTVSGFDPDYFDELAELESGYFWFVARSELITGLAARFFPTARRFVEVGWGSGTVLQAVAASRRCGFGIGWSVPNCTLPDGRMRDDVFLSKSSSSRWMPGTYLHPAFLT